MRVLTLGVKLSWAGCGCKIAGLRILLNYSGKSIDILMIQSGRHTALFIRRMRLLKQAIHHSNGVQMNLHRIVDIGSVATSQNYRYGN